MKIVIDQTHLAKLSRAIERGASGPDVKLDIDFMRSVMGRLTLWERGLLMDAVLRAGRSRKPTLTQRALLALFVHDEGTDAP